MLTLQFERRSHHIEVPYHCTTHQTSEFELVSWIAALKFAIGLTALFYWCSQAWPLRAYATASGEFMPGPCGVTLRGPAKIDISSLP
jgi:hypothetical protein